MDRILRFGVVAILAGAVIIYPSRAASDTPPQVIEVVVSLADLTPPTVTVTVPEQPAPVINMPEFDLPAPVINIPQAEPPTIVVEPSSTPAPQVIYEDREVQVDRIVEVPSCLDYTELPYFDLAAALSVGYPDVLWGLSGSDYSGIRWPEGSIKPDMNEIIGGWLQHLSTTC